MDGVVKTFKLVVHEILGYVILNCKRRENILAAYASQKYTMKKKNNFFLANDIRHIGSSTEKSLMNHLIIHFKAFLITISDDNKFVAFVNDDEQTQEIECRRYIDSYNAILKQKLGISCNDLSNLKYIERNLEIILEEDNYRCIINNERGFSIQKKIHYEHKQKFIEEICSLETLYYSKESPIFDDSYYYLIDNERKTIVGLASFLDCNDISVKTIYLNDNKGTVLYQRIIIDDYKKQQPFILEHEFSSPVKLQSLKNYFNISCLLDAKLYKNYSGYNNSSFKPINDNNNHDDNCYYTFYKLDGVLATLKFYDNHFVLTNNVKSESFSHSLSKRIIHTLKDFSFLVESELYESIFKTFNKPNPMAIIDLHTTAFSTRERMDIIQKLKRKMAKSLQHYLIFFQGDEKIKDNNKTLFYPNKMHLKPKLIKALRDKYFIPFIRYNNNNNNNNNLPIEKLQHGKIYEVYINKNYKIVSILKQRKDKIYPNSRKCIESVCVSMNL